MARRVEKSERSTFISSVAWIFIALGGLATLNCIIFYVAFQTRLREDGMQTVLTRAQTKGEISTFADVLINHTEMFFFALFMIALSILISAIGLLKRKNWARLAVIAMLPFGLIWPVNNVVIAIHYFYALLTKDFTGGQLEFGILITLIVAFRFLFGAALISLFTWTLYKLVSPSIREEFA